MIDPVLTEPHVSNRLVGGALVFLDQHFDPETVDALLAEAGLPREYIGDRERWVSLTFQNRFNHAINVEARRRAEADGKEWGTKEWSQLWWDIGAFGWDPEVLGPLYSVIRGFGSPRAVYRAIPKLTSQANRSLSFEVAADEPGRMVLAVRSAEGFGALSEDLAWNAQGMFASLPGVWGLPNARVDREETREDGDLVEVRYSAEYVDQATRLPWALADGALAIGVIVGFLAGPAWGFAAAGGVLAVHGLRRAKKAESVLAVEAGRMTEIFEESDARYERLWREEQELRRSLMASRKLSGYLAADLVEQILANPDMELSLGGRRTEAAVLFADIVGFTPRCERLTPERVIKELNIYFAFVDPAFEANDGVIDKRMGDGVMGVFVPREGETSDDVKVRAVRCGLDILRALPACNEALAAIGADPMQVRVGVAAGPLVQGNMGSEFKLEHSVVGDVVNLAARLEGAADHGSVLVDEGSLPADLDRVGPHERGEGRTIRVKGKTDDIRVVGLVPAGD